MSTKIVLSGLNVIIVPLDFLVGSIFESVVVGNPFENSCLYKKPDLITSTFICSERAFTTDAPTPCKPPDVV